MPVAAVLVNHNTSSFAELALRSLFVQNPDVPVSLTVFDNGSTDDRSGLLAAAERYGVVEHVGLCAARMLYAEQEEYLDTFALMTRAMRTHGLRHVIADDTLIMHAFAVSYPDESSALLPEKEARRDRWLARLRDRDR